MSSDEKFYDIEYEDDEVIIITLEEETSIIRLNDVDCVKEFISNSKKHTIISDVNKHTYRFTYDNIYWLGSYVLSVIKKLRETRKERDEVGTEEPKL